MKKIIIAFVTIAIIACAGQKNNAVKYRTIQLEERIPLIDNDPDSINYHVELNYTELVDYKDKKVLELVNKEFSRYFFNIEKKECSLDPIVNFKSLIIDLTQSYRNEALDLKKEYENMSYMLNYELIKQSKIIYNKNNLLIIEIETYAYYGGAHGVGNKSYLHFNMNTGATFTLKNIFSKNNESKLNQIILDRCNEKKHDEDFALFEDSKPQANENFYIDNKNFYFLYNPYEIAPYSAGYVVVDIPIKDLEELIEANSPFAFLK